MGPGDVQVGRGIAQGGARGPTMAKPETTHYNMPTLAKILGELCQEGQAREAARKRLRSYIEEELSGRSVESFGELMGDLYERLQQLVAHPDPWKKLGGVLAIRELCDVKLAGENAAKLSKFASFLKKVLEGDTEPQIKALAASTLGQLVRSGGALTAEIVENQVQVAFEWLQGKEGEGNVYGAVLILREMADNAPTVFNVHVPNFIDVIWSGLRHPSLMVREASLQALCSCLAVIEARETRYRVQWYYKLFEDTQSGLKKMSSTESIHGSLLAIGELVKYTGEFMLARYREVVHTVLQFRDHKEKTVRHSVVLLIPQLAFYAPERFARTYLRVCLSYLMGLIRGGGTERTLAFGSLADMISAVSLSTVRIGRPEMEEYLPSLAVYLREAVGGKSKGRQSSITPEALHCIGVLSGSLGSMWEPYVVKLIDPMFSCGLTSALIGSLEQICAALPSVHSTIQEKLLDSLARVLVGCDFHVAIAEHSRVFSWVKRRKQISTVNVERKNMHEVQLALRTLGAFPLQSRSLLEFVHGCASLYLSDDTACIRKEAALACIRTLEQSAKSLKCYTSKAGLHSVASEMIGQLLIFAISDPDVSVRRAILTSIKPAYPFTQHLSQAGALRTLFLGLHDEAFDLRCSVTALSGQLSDSNPAYVLPALRQQLFQLLSDLQHCPDSRHKEESTRLLACLIRSAPGLILLYTLPILRVLIEKLRAEQGPTNAKLPGLKGHRGEGGVLASVLVAIGELACVARGALQPHVVELMPLLLEPLHDVNIVNKRQVAVVALGQLAESTGYVMRAYTDFPQLMTHLLRILSDGEWHVKLEVIKVLGILGALDPYTHKQNLTFLAGEGRLAHEGVRGQRQSHAVFAITSQAPATQDTPSQAQQPDFSMSDLLPSNTLGTTSDDYYPTVALNALVRTLMDSSMSSHHKMVIRSIVFILQSLGLGCVQYLHKIMPVFFHVLRSRQDGLKDFMFQQLTVIVTIIRQHIRKYLDEMVALIKQRFQEPPLPLAALKLLEALSVALNDEFRMYMPDLLPKLIWALAAAERHGSYKDVPYILHALESFRASIDEHLHLLLPTLVKLLAPGVAGAPSQIQMSVLQSLSRLLPKMRLAGYSSAILQPLLRAMDGPDPAIRQPALDTACKLSSAIGNDFALFVPSIEKIVRKHKLKNSAFVQVSAKYTRNQHIRNQTAYLDSWGSTTESKQVKRHAIKDEQEFGAGALVAPPKVRLSVNENNLRKAWDSSQRSTKEDWLEWMRHFSVELLRESPSPALRACHSLAQVQPHMARELFAAGFMSCWSELHEGYQEQLVRSLEAAFASPTIPQEIVVTLLNLAEFMEHDEKPLPVDIRTLSVLAERCHAFAKALHYKEMEFESSPSACVESLISINNQLQQHEAAVGVLAYAQQYLNVDLKESWYEKLQRWDDALEAYEKKFDSVALTPASMLDANLGRMRCLAALARWEELSELCDEIWAAADSSTRRGMAAIAAEAAWHMGKWDEMEMFVDVLDSNARGIPLLLPRVSSLASAIGGGSAGASTSSFLRAVTLIRHGAYDQALAAIERAREGLAAELSALVSESYDRAYGDMIRVQQLTELEEVIEYSQLNEGALLGNGANVKRPSHLTVQDIHSRKKLIRSMWHERLNGVQRKVEEWQALLSVRSLVLPMSEDVDTWLHFASLCRKNGRIHQSHSTLLKLLKYDPATISEASKPGYGAGSGNSEVMLGYLKHNWAIGHRSDAFARLQSLLEEVQEYHVNHNSETTAGNSIQEAQINSTVTFLSKPPLLARASLKHALWQWSLSKDLNGDHVSEILSSLQTCTRVAPSWGKAWHHWALFNVAAMDHFAYSDPEAATRHVAPAVTGFFRSIALGAAQQPRGGNLQDILRLLTLWFNHGALEDVQAALDEGFSHISIDTWLVVIPQIIARIHTASSVVRRAIQSLLIRIGRHHPQALMYPLLVACKSQSVSRKKAAMGIIDNLRQHNPALVEQAQLVSQELIRMAILWHEMWHEALEEASRLYFGEGNVEGMLSTLIPLHEMMEKQGPETLKEIAFVQAYGRELQEAHEWILKYQKSGREAELHQAWDLYYHVFKRINKQLPSLTTLELQYVAPNLVRAQNLELAVPGTYIAGESLVTIAAFAPTLHVITSKQRPRKLTIYGGDGAEYTFLLKGHEDLRQDERVMQLLGLVNTLMSNDQATREKDYSIARYAVIPLSPNSGLIGWVPNCDTLHALIREYRDARKIPLNVEHRLMLAMAPDFDNLTVMQKVEVFRNALENTAGNDLDKVLWLKSRTSEAWLQRRTSYTRSLAVMSMVGYLLGLGDRHPSNLMLDRYSGKILHIDFGDCFEASMHREKFPEKVPFRLTRMLVKAMEVSGIEGTFRSTCEAVMHMLHNNRDSVMAMLEAFVHDPLINWRLLHTAGTAAGVEANVAPDALLDQELSKKAANGSADGGVASEMAKLNVDGDGPQTYPRSYTEKDILDAVDNMGDANEALNERAVAVMKRMSDKLTGRDFIESSSGSLSDGDAIEKQVQHLIEQATSDENLCQSYIGWCPFW